MRTQTIVDKLVYALNKIPNQRGVGPDGESTYELLGQYDRQERLKEKDGFQARLQVMMLNLQDLLIHTGEPNVSNAVVAFFNRHKSLLVVRPEFQDYADYICEILEEGGEHVMDIIHGDAFSIDTWDKKREDF